MSSVAARRATDAPRVRVRDYLRARRSDAPTEALRALRRLPLEDMLLAEGVLTPMGVERVRDEQRRAPGQSATDIVLNLHLASEAQVARALAQKFHIPFVDLDSCVVEPAARALLMGDAPGVERMLPIELDDGELTVALSEPADAAQLDALALQTGRRVVVVMATRSQIAAYRQRAPVSGVHPAEPRPKADKIDDLVAELTKVALDGRGTVAPAAGEIHESDSGLVRLVNEIVVEASRVGASDIHVEPGSGPGAPVLIRFRVDGECARYHELPAVLAQPVVSRIKILADLDIAEHRKPQDGKMHLHGADGLDIELRVATVPTVGGAEDVVLRLLPPSKPRPIDQMGMSGRDLRELKRLLDAPYGLVLCVGPTGSGKTTTLHSALGYLNTEGTKIWTAEDPVEITQRGLRQVQVNHRIGFDFATAMRAFLRADPDVIMIGEMRDAETASTAVTASLTGHLVLSTLHTNNAPETIVRLLDMGLEPFSFGDALLGVLAQRLPRALCADCREPYVATTVEADALSSASAGANAPAGAPPIDFARATLHRSRGCVKCHGSGYKGRLAIHELLVVSEELRTGIARRAAADTLRECAVRGGMRTLLQDGVAKVLAGETDLREILAVSSR